jgi:DNA invertase Pin-like site-specific DNA recombinase
MDNVGDRVKHTSLAQASEIFRLITSDKVKKTYESKKKEAQKNNTKLVWGRKPKQLDIERIKELRSQGLGYREIAKQFDCSYQTIRRLLQNTPTIL